MRRIVHQVEETVRLGHQLVDGRLVVVEVQRGHRHLLLLLPNVTDFAITNMIKLQPSGFNRR